MADTQIRIASKEASAYQQNTNDSPTPVQAARIIIVKLLLLSLMLSCSIDNRCRPFAAWPEKVNPMKLLSPMRTFAQALVKDIAQAGGIITEQDLHNAQPTIKPAIASQVWGLDIVSVPPPSSGAVLIAALHILQGAHL